MNPFSFVSSFARTNRKMFNKLENMKLREKLFFSYIVILVVPFLLFGFAMYRQLENSIMDSTLAECRQSLNKDILNIEYIKAICTNISNNVLYNKNFSNFIQQDNAAVEDIMDFKFNTLNSIENITNTNPLIYRIRFYSNNRNLDELWPVIMSKSRIIDSDLLNKVKSSNKYEMWYIGKDVTNVKGLTASNTLVSLYKIVNYTGDKELGLLEISIDAKQFFSEANSVYQPQNIYVIANRGNEKNMIGGDFQNRDDANRLENMLSANTKGSEGYFYLEHNGNRMICAYTGIKDMNANIYQLLPVSPAIAAVTHSGLLLFLLCLAAVLALSAVTYLLTSVMLKKLRIIMNGLHQIGKGELDTAIRVEGRDEFGELAAHIRWTQMKIHDLIAAVVKEQKSVRDAQIKAFFSQINRHFIFNTMEHISMKAEIEDQVEIADTVSAFGRMLGYSLSFEGRYTELKNEISHIRDYIDLNNMISGRNITLEIILPNALESSRVLKMLLQPMVENSMTHGFDDLIGQPCIRITIFSENGELYIDICDNGRGMTPERLSEVKARLSEKQTDEESITEDCLALHNVSNRLKLYFGPDYGIMIKSIQGIGTDIRLKLPLLVANDGREPDDNNDSR